MEIYGYVHTEPLQREGAKRFLSCLGMIHYGKGGRFKVSLPQMCAQVKTTDRLNVLLVGWELVVMGGRTEADECIGGNASQGLDGPLSLLRRLNKAQTK